MTNGFDAKDFNPDNPFIVFGIIILIMVIIALIVFA